MRDVESLGSAMSSHSLNTLSQRYSILKKNRDNVEMIENKLKEQAESYNNMLNEYLKCKDEMSKDNVADQLEQIVS